MVQVEPHKLSIRVRLPETDAYGVVYYANYFVYFDLARTELLRTLQVTPQYLTEQQLQFYAAQASCKYHASAHFDDALQIHSWISEIGVRSVTYRHRIQRQEDTKLLVEGRVTDVLVDAERKPTAIPDKLSSKLAAALIHD